MNVNTEIAITIGTNTPATRSASLEIGAFEFAASSTRRIISESVVSSPTLSAVIFINPLVTIPALIARSPSDRYTGMLSPVIALISTLAPPSETVPSIGIRPPARTITVSPTRICDAATVISLPSRSTVAVSGVSAMSFSIASPVLPFCRFSRYFPTVISVKIIAADSKYTSCARCAACAVCAAPSGRMSNTR